MLGVAAERRGFSQINGDVEQTLRDLIVNLVPPNQHLLIDAYCGAGFFAKALLDKFECIIGIDWDKFAVAAARENATAKETYVAGDVERELQRIGAVHLKRSAHVEDRLGGRLESIGPTTIIIDPPAIALTVAVRP